jgi:hypothetical protein
MPVQFADDALIETHVHAGKFDTRTQLSSSSLTRPSAFLSDVSVSAGVENGTLGQNGVSPQYEYGSPRSSNAYFPCCHDRYLVAARDLGSVANAPSSKDPRPMRPIHFATAADPTYRPQRRRRYLEGPCDLECTAVLFSSFGTLQVAEGHRAGVDEDCPAREW